MSTSVYEPNPRWVIVARFLFDSAEGATRAAVAIDALRLDDLAREVLVEERA